MPAPGPGEVRLRHSAVGINYIDVYVRKGEYRMVTPPAVIGMEAAGTGVIGMAATTMDGVARGGAGAQRQRASLSERPSARPQPRLTTVMVMAMPAPAAIIITPAIAT